MASQITHRQMKPFGIEVQLNRPAGSLTDADKAELRRLYALDGLILIRDLQLSMEEQLDLCSVVGPVMRDSTENYLVSNVHKEGLLGSRELLFHNDISYVPSPYLGGSLHAVDVAPDSNPTRFASGLRAYERLPQRLRDRIDALNALHVRERVEGRRSRLADMEPGDLCTAHAVVRRREADGRPYLFVNQNLTACIAGVPEAESEALIEELFSHLYAEDNIYEHAWTNGDIVIWDNLAVQHARKALGTGSRTLQRVTIAEKPYLGQFPADDRIYDELRSFQDETADAA